jgi:hypothetical protein
VISIPIQAVSVANLREHWAQRAKRAKEHRQAAHWAMKQAARPTLPCVITLTRVGQRRLDTDNLASALKACRDGVADWLEIDDGDARIEWRYAQRTGKPYIVEVNIA